MNIDDHVTIEWISGMCPVQADGHVRHIPGGTPYPFYFRARYQRWQFVVSDDPAGEPVDVLLGKATGFEREEPWGDEPYSAGYMPHEEAKVIIMRCVVEYLAQYQTTPAEPAEGTQL